MWSWQRAHWMVTPSNGGQAGLHRLLLRVEVLVHFVDGLVVGDVRGGPHEPGGGQRLDLVGRRDGQVLVIDQLVAGQLLEDELVDRLVLVERVDDVVAVFPGDFAIAVAGVAAGIGVAGDIQPVPAPLFAVMGRRQQVIDHLFPGVRRLVLDEGLDFGGRGRQPDQVEVGAADQGRRGPLRPASSSLCASSCARTKASIGVRTWSLFFTVGTGGFTGLRNDHQLRPWA